MKYGKALIARGGSTMRRPASDPVIFANLQGTVSIKSVLAMAKIAGKRTEDEARRAAFQVIVGRVLVFLVGIWIGRS